MSTSSERKRKLDAAFEVWSCAVVDAIRRAHRERLGLRVTIPEHGGDAVYELLDGEEVIGRGVVAGVQMALPFEAPRVEVPATSPDPVIQPGPTRAPPAAPAEPPVTEPAATTPAGVVRDGFTVQDLARLPPEALAELDAIYPAGGLVWADPEGGGTPAWWTVATFEPASIADRLIDLGRRHPFELLTRAVQPRDAAHVDAALSTAEHAESFLDAAQASRVMLDYPPPSPVVVLSVEVPESREEPNTWAAAAGVRWFEGPPPFLLHWGVEGGAQRRDHVRLVASVPRAELALVGALLDVAGVNATQTDGMGLKAANVLRFGTHVFERNGDTDPWHVVNVRADEWVELSRGTDTRSVSARELEPVYDGSGRFRFVVTPPPKGPRKRSSSKRDAKPENVPRPPSAGAATNARRALLIMDSGDWLRALRGLRAWDLAKTPEAGRMVGGRNRPLVLLYTPAVDSPDIDMLLARLAKEKRAVLDCGTVAAAEVFDLAPSNRAVRQRWNAAHPDRAVDIPGEALPAGKAPEPSGKRAKKPSGPMPTLGRALVSPEEGAPS